jgi:hypothetical protein
MKDLLSIVEGSQFYGDQQKGRIRSMPSRTSYLSKHERDLVCRLANCKIC